MLASSGDLRRRAWSLLYERYAREGYTKRDEQGLWYGIHDALVDAATIVVLEDDIVVGTVSIYPASPLGYPADILYKDEIVHFCSAGRTPVEIGSLAVSARLEHDRRVVSTLFDLLSLYSRCLVGATDLIITVNPKHTQFYERMLLFEQIGGIKEYPRVRGALAILLRLDLELQKKVIRWEHDEGPVPEAYDGHRTMYRLFSSRQEETRRVAWMKRIFSPLEYDTMCRYFIEERTLVPNAPPRVQDHVLDSYMPKTSFPVCGPEWMK